MSETGVGARVPRKEDDRYLRGRGQYVADTKLAGMKDVAFLRSPLAHARIRAIQVPEKWRGARRDVGAHLLRWRVSAATHPMSRSGPPKAGFFCPVPASRFSSDTPHRISKRS